MKHALALILEESDLERLRRDGLKLYLASGDLIEIRIDTDQPGSPAVAAQSEDMSAAGTARSSSSKSTT